MGDTAGPMKVWPNRVPIELVEAWATRAKAEARRIGAPVTGSAMLRHVMESALAAPTIMPMPDPDVNPDACTHPETARRVLAYATICTDCRTRLR